MNKSPSIMVQAFMGTRPWLCFTLFLLLPASLGANTLAITYFDNNTGQERFAPLSRGLADMLITDLSALSSVQVVERARINELLAELELNQSAFVDTASAVVMGKGLGARYLLTGSIAAVEPTMRIDARVIDVERGRVLGSHQVTGPSDEFFLLEKELAHELLGTLKVKLSAREEARLGRVATEDFAAFEAWSRGLEALDRGSIVEAQEALQEALNLDDRFDGARNELDRIAKRLEELGAQGSQARSATVAAFLDRLSALKKSKGPFETLQQEVMQVSMAVNVMNGARDLKEICSRVMDLALPEELKLGGPQGVQSINEWALFNYALATHNLGERAEFLTYGEAFLERYPSSVMSTSIQQMMNNVLQQMQKEEANRGDIGPTLAKARAEALRQVCHQEAPPAQRFQRCQDWIDQREEAGLPLDSDAAELFSRAAREAGLEAPIEAMLERLRGIDRYAEGIDDLERDLERLRSDRRAIERELEKRKAEPDKVLRWQRLVESYREVAQFEEARHELDLALARWPANDKLHRLNVNLELSQANPLGAEEALRRWEEAEAQGAQVDGSMARRVREFGERISQQDPAGALILFHEASALQQISQNQAAADRWVQLAQKFPTNSYFDAPSALQMAGNMYWQAGAMKEARAAFEAILAQYPKADQASGARSMLGIIPQ